MWKTYMQWLEIDRINNNWNYCKNNCRRSTRKEQCNNTNRNVVLKYQWQSRNIRQRSEILWIDENVIWCRIKRFNRSIEKTLTTPVIYKRYFTYNWKTQSTTERAKEIWIWKSSLQRRIEKTKDIWLALTKEFRKWYNKVQ